MRIGRWTVYIRIDFGIIIDVRFATYTTIGTISHVNAIVCQACLIDICLTVLDHRERAVASGFVRWWEVQ